MIANQIRELQAKPAAFWEKAVIYAGFFIFAEAFKLVIDRPWDYIRMAFFGVVGLTCLIHFKVIIYGLIQRPLIVALVGFAALSVFWSDDRGQTIERSIAMAVLLMYAVFFSVRFSLREQLRMLAIASIIFILGSFVFIFALPAYGAPEHEWLGIFVHKNTLGRMMVISALVCLTYPSTHWRGLLLRIIGYILSMYLIFGADSMTALLVTVAITGMSFVYRFLRLGGIRTAIFISAFLGPALFIAYFAATFDVDAFLTSIGRSSDFTGRTTVWENVSLAVADRPLLGYGYGAFFKKWDGVYGDFWSTNSHWAPGNAHNAFLDVSVNIGYIGLIIFALGMATVYLNSIRYVMVTRSSAGIWPILYYSFLFALSFSEDFILYNNLSWMLYISTAYTLSIAARVRDAEAYYELSNRPVSTSRLNPGRLFQPTPAIQNP